MRQVDKTSAKGVRRCAGSEAGGGQAGEGWALHAGSYERASENTSVSMSSCLWGRQASISTGNVFSNEGRKKGTSYSPFWDD